MPPKPTLSPRLALVADLTPPGCVVADIGTDHAYLPAFLVAAGVAPRAIAADIGQDPLQNAARTLAALQLEDRVALRQSDGLAAFAPGQADCFLFAGMGGTLITRLLAAAPWVNAPGTVIVAQPMRRSEDLRAWLLANGWHIATESACFDAGRPYHALRAAYAPQTPPAQAETRAGYAHYGELPRCPHPAARKLLERHRHWLAGRVQALAQSGQAPAEAARLRTILLDLEGQICL
ncbi:MAG: class I SAM-dependent methyltransferase [Oscillospiraceae bacterium]|jgi:tRNA (adenine22-N1)-methyltransferase|nr:class I SAM-dependent methyltransferase [Oscillospiraceae bacterium]